MIKLIIAMALVFLTYPEASSESLEIEGSVLFVVCSSDSLAVVGYKNHDGDLFLAYVTGEMQIECRRSATRDEFFDLYRTYWAEQDRMKSAYEAMADKIFKGIKPEAIGLRVREIHEKEGELLVLLNRDDGHTASGSIVFKCSMEGLIVSEIRHGLDVESLGYISGVFWLGNRIIAVYKSEGSDRLVSIQDPVR